METNYVYYLFGYILIFMSLWILYYILKIIINIFKHGITEYNLRKKLNISFFKLRKIIKESDKTTRKVSSQKNDFEAYDIKVREERIKEIYKINLKNNNMDESIISDDEVITLLDIVIKNMHKMQKNTSKFSIHFLSIIIIYIMLISPMIKRENIDFPGLIEINKNGLITFTKELPSNLKDVYIYWKNNQDKYK